MTSYSHSKISTFEQCKYKYKLQYIDKVKVETPTTIEAFMGDMVHQTLEHLYKLKNFNKRVALNILIKFYRDLWDKNYYVCDYKTNSRMKDQGEADEDRQLALYSVCVKDKFQDVNSVKLLWHMLAFDKDVISEKTDEQLEKLQQEVCDIIKDIESAKEFPTTVTPLCDYCVYKEICPSFKHEVELKKIEDIKKFKENEGVQLVDGFSEIKTKQTELKKSEEEFREKLIAYAKQFGIDVVYGSNKKCSVKEFDKIVLPEGENKEKFIQLMKDKGLYEDLSMVCYPRLNSKVVSGEIDEELKKMVDIIQDFRLSLSKRKDVEE